MPGIHFEITGDNKNFINTLNDVQRQVQQTNAMIERSGTSIENLFRRLAGITGVTFSVSQVESFMNKVRETRTYFQDIESTMEVFLGSQRKAADFTEKLKKYAYYNMFEFSDLAAASKQMIAYHTEVEDVIPELDKLSNIATGTKQPLMELVGMYNNARSVGYINSQQLQSWDRQGILVKETLEELGQQVQKGGVTFAQLQMVIDKYTGEGGMFHDLMANQLNNISAEEGQLADTLSLMYDEIGRKYEDVFIKYYKMRSEVAENYKDISILGISTEDVLDAGVKVSDFLLDNYKTIASSLATIITLYGEWRGTLALTHAMEKARQNFLANNEIKLLDEEIARYKSLEEIKKQTANADLVEMVENGKITSGQAEQIAGKREELSRLQVQKELAGVNSELENAERKLLDVDLQQRIAADELTLSQGQEIQKRRELLATIEETIKKRREEELAMLEVRDQANLDKVEQNRKQQNNISSEHERTLKKYNNTKEKISAIENGDSPINQKELNRLKEEEKKLSEDLLAGRKAMSDAVKAGNILEEEGKKIYLDRLDIQYKYADSDDQRLRILAEKKQFLQDELDAANDIGEQAKEELATATKRKESISQELDLLREKASQMAESATATEESASGSDIEAQIQALEEQAAALEVSTISEQANEAATKSKDLQQQIDNAVTQENAINTGTNTAAKQANTMATAGQIRAMAGLTTAQKIQMIQQSSSNALMRVSNILILQMKDAFKAFGAAIATNPLGLLITGLTLVLPYLMEFINSSDESAESAKRFGEAIDKETGNAKALLAVIESTDSTSKVHKDAVNELVNVAEDYGVQIDKEKNLTTQLIAKKDELIAKIKEEAAEREKANQIDEVAEEYEKEIVKLRKDLQEQLEDAGINKFSAMKISGMVEDDDLKRLGDLKKAYDEVRVAGEKYGGTTSEITDAAMRLKAEQDRVFIKLVGGVEDYEKANNASGQYTRGLYKQEKAIDKILINMAKQNASFNIAEGLINSAYNEQINWNDAVEVGAYKAHLQAMSCDELASHAAQLIAQWNTTAWLNLNINVDDSQVPAWVKGMGTEKLKSLVAHQEARLQQWRADGKSANDAVTFYDPKINKNRVGTVQEYAQSYVSASHILGQREEPKTKPTATPTSQKSKKGGSKWDAAEHKKKAENLLKDWSEDLEDLVKELDKKTTDAELDLMDDNLDARLAKLRENNKRELEEIEKERGELIKKKRDLDANVWAEGAKDRKAVKFEDNRTDEEVWKEITDGNKEIQNSFDNRVNSINKTFGDNVQKLYRDEAQAMYDFMKEYGNFQEQKFAIAMTYRRKLEEADTEGERESLKKKELKAYNEVDVKEAQQNIDWQSVFTDYSTIFRDQLLKQLENLNTITESEDFKKRGYDEQKQIFDIIDGIKEKLGANIRNIDFGNLGADIAYLNSAQAELEEKQKELAAALETEKSLIVKYEESLKGGNQEEIDANKKELETFQTIVRQLTISVNEADDGVKKLRDGLANKAKDIKDSMEDFASTLKLLGSNSLSGVMEGLNKLQLRLGKDKDNDGVADKDLYTSIGNLLSKPMEKFAGLFDENKGIGKALHGIADSLGSTAAGQIVQTGITILEILSEGLENLIANLITVLGNAISGLLNSLLNVKNVTQVIGGAALHAVGGILDSLTFGGFSSWFGGNGKEVQKTINDLTEKNERLIKAIDNLKDAMQKTYGSDSISVGQMTEELQRKTNQNYLDIAKAQASYVGSHHSFNKYWKGFTIKEVYRLRKQFNELGLGDWNGDLWSMTPEQMKVLQSNVDLWKKVQKTGKGNYGERVTKKLEDYIAQAGKLEEITNSLYERLTTTTADNVFDSFLNSLYALAEGSDDVFEEIDKNWQDMVNKMVINNLIGQEFQERMEAWYKKLGKLNEEYSKENSTMTVEAYKNALAGLKQEYDDDMRDAQARVEQLRGLGIIKASDKEYQQEASSKSWGSFGQEDIQELTGRFTAVQIATEGTNAYAALINDNLATMLSLSQGDSSAMHDIRDMIVSTNSYLDDILQVAKKQYDDFLVKFNSINKFQEDIYNAIRRA